MTTSAPAVKPVNWQDRVRNRGHRGGVIAMHRALARYVLSPSDLITVVLLVLLLTFVWLLLLPYVGHVWVRIMDFGIHNLPLRAQLHVVTYHLGPYLHFEIPYPAMDAILPSARIWQFTGIVTLVLFIGTFFLPQPFIPVTYLGRGILFLQASALVYFAIIPAEFPHTPNSYLEGLFGAGMAFITIVPTLFGFTYFIFQFSLQQKALLTILTMVHLSLFLPLQILAQALVLQKTVMFMPVLYIGFGLPMEVLIIIAFYSWGMTWHFRALEKREA